MKSRHRLFLLLVVAGISACWGGASGRESSTIVGNLMIKPFVMHAPAETSLGPIVEIAPADEVQGGVHIRVNGRDTETDADGVFVLGDIPPGTVTLVFATDDLSYSLVLSVPAGSTVFLHDISLDRVDQSARPRRVEIKGKLRHEYLDDGEHFPPHPSVSI